MNYDYSHYDYDYDYHHNTNCSDGQCFLLPDMDHMMFISNPMVLLEIVLLALCFLLAMPANLGIIYLVAVRPKLRDITTVYILNRAVADFVYLVADVNRIVSYVVPAWPLGEVMCKFHAAVIQVPVFASAMFLALMNANLFLGQSRAKYRDTMLRTGVGMVWVAVVLVSIPVYITSGIEHANKMCWIVPRMEFAYTWSIVELSVMFFCFTLPLAMSWIFYSLYVIRPTETSEASNLDDRPQDSEASLARDRKLMMVLNCTFTACLAVYWIPRSFMLPFHYNTFTVGLFVVTQCCLEVGLVLGAVLTLVYKVYWEGRSSSQPEEGSIALPLVS